jgi:predicted phage tail protein
MNTWQEQALHHAKTLLPDESCGLVIDVDGVQEYYPCKNIAIEGANSFTIDPEDYAKAEEKGTVLHICHSHPNGDLTASEEDIRNCDFLGLSWFIFDPIDDECIELKPKLHKPMLTRDKFIDRERTEDEKDLRKIKVYGRLAELVGWHVSYADVKNMKDVYKYLVCNYPEINKHLQENMYRITINNDVVKTEDDLLVHSEGDIRIIPVVSGAWFWVAAAFFGGGAAATAMGGAVFAAIGSVLTAIGTSMAISGVTNMLFPQQQPNVGDVNTGLSETDARVNYSFSGIQNVSRSGVCIPLIYGEVFTGSIVVSSGTDTAPVYKD